MKSAIEKLSANQRQVIELAYFEGLSQTEMAERMGQPLGNGEDLGPHSVEKFARRTGSGGVGMNCTKNSGISTNCTPWALPKTRAKRNPRAPESRLRGLYGGNETGPGSRRPSSASTAEPPPRRRNCGAASWHQSAAISALWVVPLLGLAAALSLFAAFYFRRASAIANQPVTLREQMRRQTIELTRVQEAFAILMASRPPSYLR